MEKRKYNKIDYIPQLNIFFEQAKNLKLSANAQLVYLHLLDISNKCGWVDNFCVANKVLCDRAKIDVNKLRRARETLIANGFIEYQKGYKNWHKDDHILTQKETQSDTSATQSATQSDTSMTAGKYHIVKLTEGLQTSGIDGVAKSTKKNVKKNNLTHEETQPDTSVAHEETQSDTSMTQNAIHNKDRHTDIQTERLFTRTLKEKMEEYSFTNAQLQKCISEYLKTRGTLTEYQLDSILKNIKNTFKDDETRIKALDFTTRNGYKNICLPKEEKTEIDNNRFSDELSDFDKEWIESMKALGYE